MTDSLLYICKHLFLNQKRSKMDPEFSYKKLPRFSYLIIKKVNMFDKARHCYV